MMAESIAHEAAFGPGRARAYWTAWTATLLFFAGFYILLVPLPRYLALVGLADWQIGLILGLFGVASLLGRPLAGVAVDRWGTRPSLIFGAAALVAGAGGIVLTANPVVLGGLRLFQAAGYVAFTTAGTALVIELTPEGERGRRLAVFGAAANVAITLAPALATGLLELVPLGQVRLPRQVAPLVELLDPLQACAECPPLPLGLVPLMRELIVARRQLRDRLRWDLERRQEGRHLVFNPVQEG